MARVGNVVGGKYEILSLVGKLTVRQRRVVIVGDADLGDLAGARGELRVGGMDQIRGPAGTLEPDHAAHMVAVAMSGDDVVDADIRKLLADGSAGITGVDDHTGAFTDICVAVGLYRAHHKAADLVLLGSHGVS